MATSPRALAKAMVPDLGHWHQTINHSIDPASNLSGVLGVSNELVASVPPSFPSPSYP